MDFGYFTLSDNHYENNARASNQLITDITASAARPYCFDETRVADLAGEQSLRLGRFLASELSLEGRFCPEKIRRVSLFSRNVQAAVDPPTSGT